MVMVWRRTSSDELDVLERDPDASGLLMADSEPEQLFDVDRAWHAVHMLLNGSPWGGSGPAFDAVLGGTVLGDPSTYEPVRALLPERVSAVAVLLTQLPPDELRPRFTHRAFRQAEVYPDVWDQADVLTSFVLPAYERLRAFYAQAAADRDAVLIQLT
jgi:hypothetical protein